MNPIGNERREMCERLLFSKTKGSSQAFISEYQDNFDGDRLYNMSLVEQYVSKEIQEESEFWKGGKSAYDDKILKDNVLYMTTKRADHKEHKIPEKFSSKEYNIRKTPISEYSNALYNNHVSRFLIIYLDLH